MSETRKIVAILVADVVGYSRLASAVARGLVTLPTKEHDERQQLEILSSRGCLAPRVHRRGAENAMRRREVRWRWTLKVLKTAA
jgi:hypothetical protein